LIIGTSSDQIVAIFRKYDHTALTVTEFVTEGDHLVVASGGCSGLAIQDDIAVDCPVAAIG